MSEKTQSSQYYMDILSENLMKNYSKIEDYYVPFDDSDILCKFGVPLSSTQTPSVPHKDHTF